MKIGREIGKTGGNRKDIDVVDGDIAYGNCYREVLGGSVVGEESV